MYRKESVWTPFGKRLDHFNDDERLFSEYILIYPRRMRLWRTAALLEVIIIGYLFLGIPKKWTTNVEFVSGLGSSGLKYVNEEKRAKCGVSSQEFVPAVGKPPDLRRSAWMQRIKVAVQSEFPDGVEFSAGGGQDVA